MSAPPTDYLYAREWWLWRWLNSGGKKTWLRRNKQTKKPQRLMRGHLKQFYVWSPGLFNVSSNELDNETEGTLINFIDDTPLRLEGAPWRDGLEFKLTSVGFRDWSETNQMRFRKDKGRVREKPPQEGLGGVTCFVLILPETLRLS